MYILAQVLIDIGGNVHVISESKSNSTIGHSITKLMIHSASNSFTVMVTESITAWLFFIKNVLLAGHLQTCWYNRHVICVPTKSQGS